jgi:hypothetical protein
LIILLIAIPTTVLRIKGSHFFFFGNEGNEPIHIHVEKAESYAKFWLEPVRIVVDFVFNSKQLREIESLIEENLELIKEKCDEYFTE